MHGRIASSLLVDGVVLAPKDVLYRLGRHIQYLSPQFWTDADAISLALSSPNTQFLCVSLPSIGIGTLRNTLDKPSVVEQLEKHCKRERIGTHTLYCRRPILSGDRWQMVDANLLHTAWRLSILQGVILRLSVKR